jgi:hypothetical protein
LRVCKLQELIGLISRVGKLLLGKDERVQLNLKCVVVKPLFLPAHRHVPDAERIRQTGLVWPRADRPVSLVWAGDGPGSHLKVPSLKGLERLAALKSRHARLQGPTL